MSIHRIRIEIEDDDKNIVAYYLENGESFVEINSQEYRGYVKVIKNNYSFIITIGINE